jgi:phosphate transport system substrate-binding protein
MWRETVNHTPSPRLKTGSIGIVIAAATLIAGSAAADEVTLKSADGTVNLMGDLISFTDDNYIIRTDLGDLRIAANRVRCEGATCPQFEPATGDVKIAGSDTIGDGLMPLMMNGYATFLDAEVKVRASVTRSARIW